MSRIYLRLNCMHPAEPSVHSAFPLCSFVMVHLTFSLHKEPQPLDALCPAFSVTVYRAEFTSNSWVLILGKHLVLPSRFLDLGAELEHV